MLTKAERQRMAMLHARSFAKTPCKLRKHKGRKHGPPITKERYLKALKDTGAVRSHVAEKLGVGSCALSEWMKKHGKTDPSIQAAWDEESTTVLDDAEKQVRHWVKQKYEPFVSLKASTWMLERKGEDRGFGKRSEIRVEGGKTPLRVETKNTVHIQALPLEARRALLKTLSMRGDEPHSLTPPQARDKIPAPGKVLRIRKRKA